MGCLKIEDNFLKVVSGRNGAQKHEFTVYVNPYLVTNHKAEYTKHYYIGSERFLSKPGDANTYGNENPLSTPKAGAELQQELRPNYDNLLATANEFEKQKFDSLGVQYYQPTPLSLVYNSGGAKETQYYFMHNDHLGLIDVLILVKTVCKDL